MIGKSSYIEQMENYFVANDINTAAKKRAIYFCGVDGMSLTRMHINWFFYVRE